MRQTTLNSLVARSVARTGPVLLPRDDHERRALRLIPHRRIVDEGGRAAFLGRGPSTFGARHHFVPQTSVREGAAHHDFVIAAARAVRIEVFALDAVLDE